MKELDEPIFDGVVTSPPYNINKDYASYKENKEREEYLRWMREVADSSNRVLKEKGSFFLNIGGKPSDPKVPLDVAEEFSKLYTLQNVIHRIKHISRPVFRTVLMKTSMETLHLVILSLSL